MDVQLSIKKGVLVFDFNCDTDDGKFNEKIKMNGKSFFVKLQKGTKIEDIHPDHLGLAIILAVNPFVGSVLRLPFPVSEQFLQSTRLISRYSVHCEEGLVQPYVASNESRPGLSFSGGADSTASLLLMPENTVAVFMDRPLKFGASLYNKSAAYQTIKHANDLGYESKIVECNLEYLRSPLGFPNDLSPAVPLILLSSILDLDCVAFGTVLESAYRVGHENSRDYPRSGHYRVWGGIFSAAGIPLYLPVAGISEVGTSQIVQSSSFKDYTRSCIRGKWPDSCKNCWKCFRKELVENRLLGIDLSNEQMNHWVNVKEVKKKLSAWPISHENVLSWSLQGSNSSGYISEILLSRLEGISRNMDFLERWFPESIEVVPKKYRDTTMSKISKFMGSMLDEERPQVTNHSMSGWLSSTKAQNSKEEFERFLNSI